MLSPISIEKCDKILIEGSTPRKYTKKEVEEIREVLTFFSELLIQLTKENYEN